MLNATQLSIGVVSDPGRLPAYFIKEYQRGVGFLHSRSEPGAPAEIDCFGLQPRNDNA
ncbi:MAG: hypothetical protein Q8P59_01135 [Dehalococcoidia bacterium]|nr:hypothetical protein [Dehalococcoidia bacterium]